MRLWSLHPQYLDAKGLVALWREGLLAKAVLEGKTRGYTAHPQLIRFKKQERPLDAINVYLQAVLQEAQRRGYHFDSSKIDLKATHPKIPVTSGQLAYEWKHLLGKLKVRAPERFQKLKALDGLEPHPLFVKVKGPVEPWEVVK
ncbi:pyrimidine dimer DNA glycosylase/endonuclease V [Thermococcus sibiricus]|uniref:Pyrimidine dimer DNA glycosylase n=2 Tax=Thermococcus sibiricus TaxID=172049 RepID=C6A2B4_THESM|nr:pyrimidine dimer DNA glycosylase/endonuclease V [Thermococcus sibiricus]ACS89759.1 Pyrimidine dimer DNA glycosylase [Thermococcus sibiricus MM 739]KUK17140.1 MAG: Pyrimidine dimer DNA glycosylase [Thermococcus sibiricus]